MFWANRVYVNQNVTINRHENSFNNMEYLTYGNKNQTLVLECMCILVSIKLDMYLVASVQNVWAIICVAAVLHVFSLLSVGRVWFEELWALPWPHVCASECPLLFLSINMHFCKAVGFNKTLQWISALKCVC